MNGHMRANMLNILGAIMKARNIVLSILALNYTVLSNVSAAPAYKATSLKTPTFPGATLQEQTPYLISDQNLMSFNYSNILGQTFTPKTAIGNRTGSILFRFVVPGFEMTASNYAYENITLNNVGDSAATALGFNAGCTGAFVCGVVRWVSGSWTEIPGIVSGGVTRVTAINNVGEVSGWAHFNSGSPVIWHAYKWSQSTGTVDLGVEPGYSGSAAYDINEIGEVVGDSHLQTPTIYLTSPFIHTAGVLNPLPLPTGETSGHAAKINNSGTVVGNTAHLVGQSVVTSAAAWIQMQHVALPIPTPSRPSVILNSSATGISNDGTIVGQMLLTDNMTGESYYESIIWTLNSAGVYEAHTINNLLVNPIRVFISSALQITDAGRILGVCFNPMSPPWIEGNYQSFRCLVTKQ